MSDMTVQIQPGRLRGRIAAPPSKSAAHRAAICAALSPGSSVIHGVELTQDMQATMDGVSALGARCSYADGVLAVTGIGDFARRAAIDCNESGSTLRFLVPIAAGLGTAASFTGRGQLPQRPMQPLTEALEAHGVACSRAEGEILSISGQLKSGIYAISGAISSQYVTGLLFGLSLLPGDSDIRLTSPLQSAGYVDMTLQMMEEFGVQVHRTPAGYRVPGGQRYRERELQVEGDYSGAAFWLCAGAINSDITVMGLREDSLQGDRKILDILAGSGAEIRRTGLEVRSSCRRRGSWELDVSHIPDLVPALAGLAAYCDGVTVFSGAERLRLKESDRLETITQGLSAMGAIIEARKDRLIVKGQRQLLGGATVSSHGDHRIAMALSIAALGCKDPVTVTGAQCVSKSYPGFYDDFMRLGGRVHVL